MTLEEAKIVARVIGTADGGCSVCVENLCDELNGENLGFTWTPGDERYIVNVEATKDDVDER